MAGLEIDPSTRMRVYEPEGAVLRQFLADRSHISIIRGPLGSGTSSACCMRIYSAALEQRKSLDGKRRSRWIVVRDSYPNLRNTTIRTWLDWFPEEDFGRFYWERPCRHEIRIGDIELDVIFLSMDEEKDVAKCRSLEYTGCWINELEYHKFLLFMEIESRTGRFPSMKDGGSSWDGVVADMNAPDETHWLPKMTGEVAVEGDEGDEDGGEAILSGLPFDWKYFVQPPAVLEVRDPSGRNVVGYKVNPGAENLKWLKPGFYEEKCRGKTKAWIDSRLRNQITFVVDGTPVFGNFNPDFHIADTPLEPVSGHDVTIGLDFGRNRPAAICSQEIDGRLFVQHEFRRYGMPATSYAPALKHFLQQTYPGYRLKIFGDPKGRDRGQADDRTAYDVFEANGMIVIPAPVKTNSRETRIMAVDAILGDNPRGVPSFMLSKANCPTLKAALCGRYRVKKNALGEAEPVKDKYSDIADALQYAVLGLGWGREIVGQSRIDESPARMKAWARKPLGARKVA